MAGKAMPPNQSAGRARSILGMGWAGVHLPGSLNIRLSNWDDANTAIRIGTDPNRPLLDLLADEFLDLGHVGVGFEVPPEGIISQASHRSIQSSTEKGASTEIYVSAVAIGPKASPANLGVVFRKHDRQYQRRHALENQAMRRFRFHIGTLVLVVLLLGIGLAALRESDETWDSGLFSITLIFLSISILLGLHRTGSSQGVLAGVCPLRLDLRRLVAGPLRRTEADHDQGPRSPRLHGAEVERIRSHILRVRRRNDRPVCRQQFATKRPLSQEERRSLPGCNPCCWIESGAHSRDGE